jgi:hypothetical protein
LVVHLGRGWDVFCPENHLIAILRIFPLKINSKAAGFRN